MKTIFIHLLKFHLYKTGNEFRKSQNSGLSQNSKNINAIYENYIYSFAKILLI